MGPTLPVRSVKNVVRSCWQRLCKSFSAFAVQETNYKGALKLSLVSVVFCPFLSLFSPSLPVPLTIWWVNCSDSGTFVCFEGVNWGSETMRALWPGTQSVSVLAPYPTVTLGKEALETKRNVFENSPSSKNKNLTTTISPVWWQWWFFKILNGICFCHGWCIIISAPSQQSYKSLREIA